MSTPSPAVLLAFALSAASSMSTTADRTTSPLIEAARKGDVAGIEREFLQGADLNQTTTGGRTPLHEAGAEARDEAVSWLIAHEANVFAKDQEGRTPADVSSELGHRSTSTLLKKFMFLLTLEQQASASESWDDLVDILTRDSRRYTLLHVLAIRGNVEEARRRIEAGADVNARTVLGITPLMKAAALHHPEMVRLLIKAGADVNARDQLDNTALIAAVVAGDDETVRTLLAAKADSGARSRNGGGTALELANRLGRAAIQDLLRAAGAR